VEYDGIKRRQLKCRCVQSCITKGRVIKDSMSHLREKRKEAALKNDTLQRRDHRHGDRHDCCHHPHHPDDGLFNSPSSSNDIDDSCILDDKNRRPSPT
jgi:hypothetical protein